MTSSFERRARTLLGAAVLAPLVSAGAQASCGQGESRQALIEKAAREESAGRRANAAGIRARLADGDFQEGSRVVVLFENNVITQQRTDATPGPRPDTLSVRFGGVLQFPQARYPDIRDFKVSGLLRCELGDSLRKHFAVWYKDPQLRVTPLIGLTIIGAVQRSGPVDVPADARLGDLFNLAGGLATDADVGKIYIRRNSVIIIDAKAMQAAVENGLTVDNAQLRAGDQINVPRKTPSNWLAYAGFAMAVVTLIVTISRNQ
jgi:protein involved in polysaccharide export with SLBB domain